MSCLQGPGLPRESATPSPPASSGRAGESGRQNFLATSCDHSGTCKLPGLPPRPHRDQPRWQWRVWPGIGPGERWCWPGGSPPWRWPCWSREREALMKGSIPTPSKTAPARQALTPGPPEERGGQSRSPGPHGLLPPGRSRRQLCPVARSSRAWRR